MSDAVEPIPPQTPAPRRRWAGYAKAIALVLVIITLAGFREDALRAVNLLEGAVVDSKGCEVIVERVVEIRLPSVNFETNSDRLLSGAESELDAAAKTLKSNPSVTVEVAGYTDDRGNAASAIRCP